VAEISFTEQVRHVEAEYTDDAFADRVKDLVQSRLEASNPEASLERTAYFNHSAIPDFVLSWPSQSRPRYIYLRGSYAAIVASGEMSRVANAGPMFVSLGGETEFDLGSRSFDRRAIAALASESGDAMLTDVTAFSSATAPTGASEEDQFPLLQLVKSHYVRGGRGLFDDFQVQALTSTDRAARTRPLLSMIADSFIAESVTRIRRAAAIIDLVEEPEGGQLSGPLLGLLSGRLDREEVRSLLPWVLRNAPTNGNDGFWRTIGSLVDLAMLESESSALQGLDLSGLVEANLGHLSAVRAYAGLNVDETLGRSGSPIWRMFGNTLTRLLHDDATRFAHLGTRLKAQGSHATPKWEVVRDRLAGRAVRRAVLRGLEQSVTVDSRNDGNLRDYLDGVTSVGERNAFFVDEIMLDLTGDSVAPDERRLVTVDFGSRLVIASSDATLAELLEAVALIDSLAVAEPTEA
jgi:hypothetical protein